MDINIQCFTLSIICLFRKNGQIFLIGGASSLRTHAHEKTNVEKEIDNLNEITAWPGSEKPCWNNSPNHVKFLMLG